MKHDSTPTDAVKEEVFLLAVQAFCGDLSDAEARRFEQLILSDPKARRLYVEFICDVGNLRLLMNRYDSVGGVEAAMLGGGGIGLGGIGGAAIVPSADLPGLGFSPAADYATEDAFASDRFGALGKGAGIAAATSQSSPRPAMPSEPERHSALFVADDPPSYSRLSLIPLDSHLGGWLFSYSVAAVFLCLLLLGFWAYKLPSDRGSSIARNENSRGLTAPGELSPARPAPVFVGHITGIAGAKWSDDPDYLPPIGVRVALGRKYKLKSGLLEITYDSGARVILEGPCSYEVDSTAGGYLSLGKLTARIEDRGEGIGGSGMKADSLATRHQPLATDPSPLSSLPSPLFTVRTPTAVVTDLGTEFGVECDELGATTSHVFQGRVKVQLAAYDAISTSDNTFGEIVLGENESARVEKLADDGGSRMILFKIQDKSASFKRHLIEKLDLLDIVAGGNGLGRLRERGIDPASGNRDLAFTYDVRGGDRQYHWIGWHPLIDGVFVPDGGTGPVQLDSAGHVFDGFPKTNGEASCTIWAQGPEVLPVETAAELAKQRQLKQYWTPRPEQLMPERRGLLGIHSNAGITFRLDAMRRAFPSVAPSRFQAIAVLDDVRPLIPEAEAMVDLWVFVDGQMKFKREKLRFQDGTINVDVALKSSDRFLTLAVTDGGDRMDWDTVLFGDPVVQMSPVGPENRKEGRPMKE